EKKLENNGYAVRVLELINPSKITWYLVRTGVYSKKEKAESTKKKLKDDLGIDAIIRPFGRF
ncbi:MAG: SPOR domain-containing protein, partial [Desulfobacteraceae bacterium]|nr:SPOR domain-containing protein [Desulfobacteraceae bacterium]